jgi:hypothetical protein
MCPPCHYLSVVSTSANAHAYDSRPTSPQYPLAFTSLSLAYLDNSQPLITPSPSDRRRKKKRKKRKNIKKKNSY